MTPPWGSSAGYRIYRLFPVSRRVEAERNALPIGVAYLPLTAVLLGDYPIKLGPVSCPDRGAQMRRPRRAGARLHPPAGRECLCRGDRSGMTARMYLSSVGWPRAGREM